MGDIAFDSFEEDQHHIVGRSAPLRENLRRQRVVVGEETVDGLGVDVGHWSVEHHHGWW